MEQKTLNRIKIGIITFGVVLAVVLTSLFVWSLTRPPVTTGPELDQVFPQQR